MMVDDKKWTAFKEKPSLEVLTADPAFVVVNAFIKNWDQNYQSKFVEFSTKNEDLGRSYLKGLFEMDPKSKAIHEMLEKIDINTISPVEALLKLNEILSVLKK